VRFLETALRGSFIIELQPQADERGFFARAWCANEFEEHGLQTRMVQANLSGNRTRGTLRGLHYQVAPYEEAKLVRCIRGAIFDVIVDLRVESPTYGQWIGVELTAENRRMLYVPERFAHGFQSLEDDTEIFYQVSQFYTPGAERGIRWDDPSLAIAWPYAEHRVISPKDQSWPAFTLAPEASS
jgi:dTDP-4-dehydrorhamnose 3,5-epimerase